MIILILNRLALLILIVLLGSLCLPAGAANWPDQFYAPYINIEMYAPPTINDVYDATGVKYYSLGFITANTTTGKLRFGDHPEADYYKDQIDTLRTKGGDVIISFGGAFAEKPNRR